MLNNLLTIAEAAERLRIRPRTVRRWVTLREIEYVKAGKSIRISEVEIQRIISDGTMRRAVSGRPNTLEDRAVQTSDVKPQATADVEHSSAHKSDAAPKINAADQVNNLERSPSPGRTMPLANRPSNNTNPGLPVQRKLESGGKTPPPLLRRAPGQSTGPGGRPVSPGQRSTPLSKSGGAAGGRRRRFWNNESDGTR
jgi:excisionase family DNA binding protein